MFDQVSSLPVPLLEWSLCSFLLQESPSLWQPNVHLMMNFDREYVYYYFSVITFCCVMWAGRNMKVLAAAVESIMVAHHGRPTLSWQCKKYCLKHQACDRLTWIEARPSSMKCTAGELATFLMLCTIFMPCKRKSLLYLQNNRVKGRYRSDMVMLG